MRSSEKRDDSADSKRLGMIVRQTKGEPATMPDRLELPSRG